MNAQEIDWLILKRHNKYTKYVNLHLAFQADLFINYCLSINENLDWIDSIEIDIGWNEKKIDLIFATCHFQIIFR